MLVPTSCFARGLNKIGMRTLVCINNSEARVQFLYLVKYILCELIYSYKH